MTLPSKRGVFTVLYIGLPLVKVWQECFFKPLDLEDLVNKVSELCVVMCPTFRRKSVPDR